MGFDTKLGSKESEIRDWCIKQIGENYADYDRMLKAKTLDQELKIKQELNKFKAKFTEDQKNEQRVGAGGDPLNELTLKEAVDNMGMSLKADLLQLFEDDRKLKNIRFQEVFHLIDSNKQLLNEHIAQQFESLKALTKAFVNKEVAERASSDSSILDQVNRRLEGLDQVFDAKLKADLQNIQKSVADARTGKDNFEDDVRKVVAPDIKEMREALQKARERLDQQEVKAVMDEMLEQLTQEHMDDKFEEALDQVAKSMHQYSEKAGGSQKGSVKSDGVPARDFDELNQKLETKFAQNVKQIQESLTQLNTDLKTSKERVQKLEGQLAEIDKNAKKKINEMHDRVEVERCVQEMVSWVSEQITNQQVVENLNKVARKVNQIGEKVYQEGGSSQGKEKPPAEAQPPK